MSPVLRSTEEPTLVVVVRVVASRVSQSTPSPSTIRFDALSRSWIAASAFEMSS